MTDQFLTDLQSEDAAIRFAAWRRAGEMPAGTIPELGKLAASANPGVAKAAREALTTMAHSVGKDPSAPKRGEFTSGLLALSGPANPPAVRVHAIRLLSNIGGADAVPALAKLLGEPAVREEAIYAVERIPGAAAEKALLDAYAGAADEFKPRVLAALGHRRVAGAAPLCMDAMRSPNKEIAVAAVRAFGRIGVKPGAPVRQPAIAGASAWDALEITDSMLRYADAQARGGDAAEAMRLYRAALDRPEEHWQCAGIIGLAKIGTPEAAAAIHSKTRSENRRVRITAVNAWKGMVKA